MANTNLEAAKAVHRILGLLEDFDFEKRMAILKFCTDLTSKLTVADFMTDDLGDQQPLQG